MDESRYLLREDAPVCDIVMKGGITSGIVYPTVVSKLAESYRFKSVGGTSAGAIAAVAAAAAELGRVETAGRSFEALAEMPILLGEDVGRETRLESVFNADPGTRRVFRILRAAVVKKNHFSAAVLLLANFPFHVLMALALTVAGAILASVSTLSWVAAACVFFAAGLLVVLGPLVDLARAVGRTLPENNFGLSTLGPACDRSGRPALTQWLHDRIQVLAGRESGDRPVTFGDLWLGRTTPIAWGASDDADYSGTDPPLGLREVALEMMTTDLTHGLAMRLPVPPDPHKHGDRPTLLVSLADLARYFPTQVVDHFEERAEPPGPELASAAAAHGLTDLRVFPTGAQLPIVVAARMSLSFPLLISAVRLWEVVPNGHALEPRPVWFSDGGMTSNFPIHFFDRPLPRWPTFAITFVDYPEGAEPDPDDPDANIEAPPDIDAPWAQTGKRLSTLVSFLVAIKDATQNWRDKAQGALPGFRERIIGVRLATGEGGLNLSMDAQQIDFLGRRGEHAALRLAEQFPADAPAELTTAWNRHRFARYRTALALVEQLLTYYRRGYQSSPTGGGTISYAELHALERPSDPYRFSSAVVGGAASELSDELVERAGSLETTSVFDENVPHPHPTLRIVPPA